MTIINKLPAPEVKEGISTDDCKTPAQKAALAHMQGLRAELERVKAQCHDYEIQIAGFRVIKAQRDELLAALKDIFSMFDENWIVRDISRDHESDFHIRMLGFTQRLAKAQAAIANAERGKQ